MSADENEFLGFEDQNGVSLDSFPGKSDVATGRCGIRRKLEEIIENQKSKTYRIDTGTEMVHKKEMAGKKQMEKMNVDENQGIELEMNDGIGEEKKRNTKKDPKTNKYSTRDNWIKNTTNTVFFLERINQADKPMHAMEVAKMLHNIGIKNYKELKFAGQGRYRVSFNRPKEAEDLINSRLLTEEFKYRVYVPNMLKESVGVVRNVAPSLSEEEILNNIQTAGKKKVVKVERISRMRDGVLIPTYSIKIFVEGQELPESVAIYGVCEMVEAYIFPIKMCKKCWRYGHRVNACKSAKGRCENCGSEQDGQGQDCVNPCINPTNCIQCKQTHKVTDRNCPERIRQDKIRYVMANERLTFMEASNKFPKSNQAQHRLDSLTEFPPMIGNDSNNARQNTRPQTSQTGTVKKPGNQLKQPPIEQTNFSNIISKITAIQKSILKHAEKSRNGKDTIDTDILLINISDQIKSIIEPEVAAGTSTRTSSVWPVSGI